LIFLLNIECTSFSKKIEGNVKKCQLGDELYWYIDNPFPEFKIEFFERGINFRRNIFSEGFGPRREYFLFTWNLNRIVKNLHFSKFEIAPSQFWIPSNKSKFFDWYRVRMKNEMAWVWVNLLDRFFFLFDSKLFSVFVNKSI